VERRGHDADAARWNVITCALGLRSRCPSARSAAGARAETSPARLWKGSSQ
jgi:hypothetical protein